MDLFNFLFLKTKNFVSCLDQKVDSSIGILVFKIPDIWRSSDELQYWFP